MVTPGRRAHLLDAAGVPLHPLPRAARARQRRRLREHRLARRALLGVLLGPRPALAAPTALRPAGDSLWGDGVCRPGPGELAAHRVLRAGQPLGVPDVGGLATLVPVAL